MTDPGERPRGSPDAGLTLVELLVTMVVASLVASSTFVFFAGQKTVYETQTKILNVQQNLWAALETITVNVRVEGNSMVGCVRPDADGLGPDSGDPPPTGATPPLTGLRVWIKDPTPPGYTPNAANRLAPIWIQNGNGTPDALTVVYGLGASGNFVDSPLAPGSFINDCIANINLSLAVPPMTSAFLVQDFMMLVHNGVSPPPPSGNQDRGCSLFQITTVNAPSELQKMPSSMWNIAGVCPGLFTMGNPAVVTPYSDARSGVRNFGQLRWIRFAVIPDAATGIPNLTMQRLDIVTNGARQAPQVLAEGIENMQIAFGCDLAPPGGVPPDGVITENLAAPTTDEWFLNTVGDVIDPRCNRPQAVRITIIARSPTRDTTLSYQAANRMPATEDSAQGAVDQFRHKLLRTTVFPRN